MKPSPHSASPFRRMKSAAAALLLALVGLQAMAVDPPKGWEPRTGDAWVDRQLEDINAYGDRYREAFVDELVRYQSAPRELAYETLGAGWKPGDLYYACALAQLIGQPCRKAVEEWTRDHEKGWLDVGKRLGIAPGSAQFGELKRGFVASYERWARPLELDAELRKSVPSRDKGDAARGGAGKRASR